MKLFKTVSIGVALLFSQYASAVPFEPTFSDYIFPGSQHTVDAAANAFFSTNYGITIDNAYLYKDSRDTFDGIGISVGAVSQTGTPQTGQVNFLDTTDFVEIDYWGILPTSYSAFNAVGDLLDTFSIGGNTLGTYLFNTTDIISYITWSSTGGYGQISGLRYDYDGTTDGRNNDIGNVPEPGTIVLLSLGLIGLGFSRRAKA